MKNAKNYKTIKPLYIVVFFSIYTIYSGKGVK